MTPTSVTVRVSERERVLLSGLLRKAMGLVTTEY